jgi:ADP-ribose pyrophosphatase YjhB (NUDIX family)
MNDHKPPAWLAWAREIQSMCQTGLAFSRTGYETMRYRRLMEIAAEMVNSQTGIPARELVENFSAQPGYATVKVDVRGAVVRDSRILLVQEKADLAWSMPGGWAHVGEHPSRMVSREVREESGLFVSPRQVVGIYDADRSPVHLDFYHAYKIIFLCEAQAGEPKPGDETVSAEFFPFDGLPTLSGYRTTRRHLSDVLALLEDPGRPTVFD